jgi:hypothetical protein
LRKAALKDRRKARIRLAQTPYIVPNRIDARVIFALLVYHAARWWPDQV